MKTSYTYDARKAFDDYVAELVERGLFPRRGQEMRDGMYQDPYTEDPIYRHLYDAATAEGLAELTPAAMAEARQRSQAQKARQYVTGVLNRAAIARRAEDMRRLTVVRSEFERLTAEMRSNATPEIARMMDRTDNAIRRLGLERQRRRARIVEIARTIEASRDEHRGDPDSISRIAPAGFEVR